MTPLITVVVPTYNSAETLEECLQSIVRQTYLNKNVVVVDGQSTDNTLAILEKYKSRYPFVDYVSEKDNGIYDAMNKGVDRANGNYLLFLGSDDAFYSENVLETIFTDPQNDGIDFLYGDVFLKHARKTYSGPSSFEKLLGDQVSICHQAIFYRKELFETVGKYNLGYFIHADYDLNVRCFKTPGLKIKYVNVVITLYNERGISGQTPNADGFHNDLTLDYITNYAEPFDLILRLKKAQREVETIKESTTYKLAKLIALPLLKLHGFRASVSTLLKPKK